jgi:hypothetical protein
MTFQRVGVAVFAVSCLLNPTTAFTTKPLLKVQSKTGTYAVLQPVPNPDDDLVLSNAFDISEPSVSRRQAISLGVTSVASIIASVSQEASASDGVYITAKRPTAYIVDSTIPPTLIPLNAREETKIFSGLGRGSGTNKDAIADDSVNLNNILNKAVFGAIDAISGSFNGQDETQSGPGYASFVCLGLPQETNPVDVDLAAGILTPIIQARKSIKGESAMGLAFAPLSTQSALDAYLQDGNDAALLETMIIAGVPESTIQLYTPLLQLAKSRNLKLLALAPEVEDSSIVRKQGLQNVNTDRRAQYVADAEGFIALTQDPKFKLYTERSLLKDFEPMDDKDQQGNFFAQRILVHEAAATALAKYAVSRPDSFVAVIAPTPDLRFLGGINGRIPRVCEYLNKETNKVTNDAVTTILLNPTATVSLKTMLKCDLQVATVSHHVCSLVGNVILESVLAS